MRSRISLKLAVAILGLLGTNLSCSALVFAQGQNSKLPRPTIFEEGVKSDIDDAPPLKNELLSRTDKHSFDQFLRRSTKECEAFRQRLLNGSENQPSIETIVASCVEFKKQARPHLKDRTSINNFRLDPPTLVERVNGDAITLKIGSATYSSFAGKWFGRWDGSDVDHHWGSYEPQDPLLNFNDSGPTSNERDLAVQIPKLLGFQYAWVGDGYALNHLATTDESSPPQTAYLLGYVVHLKDKNLQDENARRPHVGIIDGPGRLIWITAGEVFLEEVLRDDSNIGGQYAITGFRYKFDPKLGDQLTAQKGFQAIYSRDDSTLRAPWISFPIDIRE